MIYSRDDRRDKGSNIVAAGRSAAAILHLRDVGGSAGLATHWPYFHDSTNRIPIFADSAIYNYPWHKVLDTILMAWTCPQASLSTRLSERRARDGVPGPARPAVGARALRRDETSPRGTSPLRGAPRLYQRTARLAERSRVPEPLTAERNHSAMDTAWREYACRDARGH